MKQLLTNFRSLLCFRKSLLLILLGLSIAGVTCDYAPRLIVMDSNEITKTLTYGGLELHVNMREFLSKLIIPMDAKSQGISYIYPQRMMITIKGNLWEYRIVSEDLSPLSKDSVEVAGKMISFAYTGPLLDESRREYYLKRGDEVILYGQNYIKNNGQLYDLDSLIFVVP